MLVTVLPLLSHLSPITCVMLLTLGAKFTSDESKESVFFFFFFVLFLFCHFCFYEMSTSLLVPRPQQINSRACISAHRQTDTCLSFHFPEVPGNPANTVLEVEHAFPAPPPEELITNSSIFLAFSLKTFKVVNHSILFYWLFNFNPPIGQFFSFSFCLFSLPYGNWGGGGGGRMVFVTK